MADRASAFVPALDPDPRRLIRARIPITTSTHGLAYGFCWTNYKLPYYISVLAIGGARADAELFDPPNSLKMKAKEKLPSDVIARRLDVPVVSKTPEQTAKQFGFLGPFVGRDNPVSSRLTQERLGWRPTKLGLLTDLNDAGYFA